MSKALKKDSTHNSLRGVLGIAFAILILQSDTSLVPICSWIQAFAATWVPRDTDDKMPKNLQLLIPLYVIDKTYRGFPFCVQMDPLHRLFVQY
jgi:hypothetical protein